MNDIENVIGKLYITRYTGIKVEGVLGVCIDVVTSPVFALKIKFNKNEEFWFLRRDLEEI